MSRDPGLFVVRTPKYLRRQPALIKASVVTAGLPWTHSTILRAGKYDYDQWRPLRAPRRLRGLLLVSISPPWCPFIENKSGPSQVSRLPTGLNYQVALDPISLPSNTLRQDEECVLNSLKSPKSTTETRKLCSNPTRPVTDHKKPPARRAPKRLPSARKPARERTYSGLPSTSEACRPADSPSPASITMHAPSAPLEEHASNSLAPLRTPTMTPELCSSLTVLNTNARKRPRHCTPSVRKPAQGRAPPEPHNDSVIPTEPLSPPSVTVHTAPPFLLLDAPVRHARRRFAPPSKEMLQLLVETELALLPTEVSSKRPKIQLQPPASVSQTTPPRTEDRTKEGESRPTPTITQRHINTNSLFLGTHDTSPALVTRAEAEAACAKSPCSRFVHDYRLEYTHLPSILQTTIRIPPSRAKASTPLLPSH
ncbi:hypothetical protein CCMSSC00406_0005678 [Pleurotus cornucopiae]|nr:hypothetical protein CCMSSC00406_0005678 [Pleurotus cornucopiae]